MWLIIIPCWLICLMHGMRWKRGNSNSRRSFQHEIMNMFESFFVVENLTKNRWKSPCLILHDLCNEYIIYSIRPLSLFIDATIQCYRTCGSSRPANLFNDKNTYQLNTKWPILLGNKFYTNSMYLKVRSCYNKWRMLYELFLFVLFSV